MAELPTGTVTFVFTDIEGSTSMLQRLGDDFLGVLEEHHRLIRDAFGEGTEIRSEGDAFFYVFPSAPAAIRAACSAQRHIAAFDWPEGGSVLVRIGMHTGEGVLGGDDYVGIDVHRAARIVAAGHGGQILISEATRLLSATVFNEDVVLTDLGEHRLKDLHQPEHIFQVVVGGLPNDFPPIASLDVAPNNLPSQPTSFVGRARESDEVRSLLGQHRLVTLTGASGTGKTRLAIHVATAAQSEFPDGVYFVPLDSLASAELVATAIADGLGIVDESNGSTLEAVIETARTKTMLVLLDNFEHVLPASADVSALLVDAPALTVLATSQRPLRIRGEHPYQVPPMSIDEATALFVDLTDAGGISDDQRPVVEAIVELLDRVPLAIELTAPRMNLFGLAGLRDRLTERLEVPEAGLGDAPERHRSLTNAISWSYDLLDPEHRSLLRQLSIFEGGFTLDAAEAVADTSTGTTEGVAELLDRSLIRNRVQRGEVRFSMLESVRRFALDELSDAGEDAAAAERHAHYFVSLTETAAPELEGAGQQVWVDRFADELDNVRAVLRLSRDTGDPDLGLRTAGSIWRFYHRRGHLVEGREWLELLLEMEDASPAARAIGLEGLAGIEYWQADYSGARDHYEELLALYEALGQQTKVADTLFALATTTQWLDDLAGGRAYAEQAQVAYEAAGAPHGAARVAAGLAWNAWRSGGDLEGALELWTEARALSVAIGDESEVRQHNAAISAILLQLGRTGEAIEVAAECLDAMVEAADAPGTIMAIDFLSAAVAGEEPEAAVSLAAAAESLRSEAGGGISAESVDLEPVRSQVAGVLDPAAIDAAWDEGAELSFEEAAALGFEVVGRILG